MWVLVYELTICDIQLNTIIYYSRTSGTNKELTLGLHYLLHNIIFSEFLSRITAKESYARTIESDDVSPKCDLTLIYSHADPVTVLFVICVVSAALIQIVIFK